MGAIFKVCVYVVWERSEKITSHPSPNWPTTLSLSLPAHCSSFFSQILPKTQQTHSILAHILQLSTIGAWDLTLEELNLVISRDLKLGFCSHLDYKPSFTWGREISNPFKCKCSVYVCIVMGLLSFPCLAVFFEQDPSPSQICVETPYLLASMLFSLDLVDNPFLCYLISWWFLKLIWNPLLFMAWIWGKLANLVNWWYIVLLCCLNLFYILICSFGTKKMPKRSLIDDPLCWKISDLVLSYR